ncbi:MAG: hypothetical protein ACD_54C01287G0002, partial [uncultured bacterium]
MQALADQDQCGFTGAEVADGAGEILLAEQALADGWRVDQPGPEVQERGIARLQRHLRPGKRGGGLGHGNLHLGQRALGQKARPIGGGVGQTV